MHIEQGAEGLDSQPRIPKLMTRLRKLNRTFSIRKALRTDYPALAAEFAQSRGHIPLLPHPQVNDPRAAAFFNAVFNRPREIAEEERTMKSILTRAAVAALLSGVALGSQAGTRDPGVNARQHNQHERITQGVRSGALTRREARRVGEEQKDVRQLERAYKSDGRLTAHERADLHHEQNQASRDIYRQKHDRQSRPGNPGTRGIHDPRVNARQAHQKDRIEQGVQSGELTARERRRVGEEQQDVRQLERAYKSDGRLTANERADLQHEQNQASRDIYRQKHDAQERPSP